MFSLTHRGRDLAAWPCLHGQSSANGTGVPARMLGWEVHLIALERKPQYERDPRNTGQWH